MVTAFQVMYKLEGTYFWWLDPFFGLRGHLADFGGIVESRYGHILKAYSHTLAPKIGSLPLPFEIFQRQLGFLNFGLTLIILVSNCSY